MPSDVIQTFLDGLQDRETDLGAQVTYAGTTYPCSAGDQYVSRLLELAGFKQTIKIIIIVRLAVFPPGISIPSHKQGLAYVSAPGVAVVNLRVDTIDTLFGAILVINCEDPNQAA